MGVPLLTISALANQMIVSKHPAVYFINALAQVVVGAIGLSRAVVCIAVVNKPKTRTRRRERSLGDVGVVDG
ncbi:hypothetical protein F2P79_004219 [Pimephales promelas]|nr:hypothetical protein F2P79_004219 [Pimephales promelas]